MILLASRGIARIPHLEVLLGETVRLVGWPANGGGARCVAGWGMKASAAKAHRLATRLDLPYLALEDGFLRSLGIGDESAPLSVVVDDLGIYYDANRPSRLEQLIAEPLLPAAVQRATALRQAWCQGEVSKYNAARTFRGTLPEGYVLVVDQTLGDASITYGRAEAESFTVMLEAARKENPGRKIVLKVHPEVARGRKRGHFDLVALAACPEIAILGDDAHPAALIRDACAIYVVTSQMGFEGLLWGKRVRTFGMPFYAGWGLTVDNQERPGRRCDVPLANLVHAALVGYPRYLDPETAQRSSPERLIEWMALQRRMRERFGESLLAIGFPGYKQDAVRQFLQGSRIEFRHRRRAGNVDAAEVFWGMRGSEEKSATPSGGPTLRIEDGFLRSVGLGAERARPLSWVIDRQGMYYDAGRPSDLECILQEADFDQSLLLRAAALRQRLVDSGATKYNVGRGRWQRPASACRVILVPGQVESDASIAYGVPTGLCSVRHNVELLRAVRAENPEAYLVYKPHPDVVAGLRRAGRAETSAAEWCDEIVRDVPMGALLGEVDEVHVLTSLAGFEALLRGRQVHCHGLPFYAGWGLTRDRVAIPRRTRRLSLDALVAGALILYPTYVSRRTGVFTTAERALDELLAWQASPVAPLARMRHWLLRRLLRWFKW